MIDYFFDLCVIKLLFLTEMAIQFNTTFLKNYSHSNYKIY